MSAGHISSPDSRRALETLCEIYWHPLYAYARRRVTDVSEAQDLTQAFFAQLLEKNYVGSATPDRGRFRAFLLTAFKHFLSKQWEKEKAQKRGGGRTLMPLDFEAAELSIRIEPASGLTAEQIYDQQWAITLLGKIMELLEAEPEWCLPGTSSLLPRKSKSTCGLMKSFCERWLAIPSGATNMPAM